MTKKGFNEFQAAVSALRGHPKVISAEAIMRKKFKSQLLADVDEYGKAFLPRTRKIVTNTAFQAVVPGSTEALVGYLGASAHAREMIRNPKYRDAIMTIMKTLPK
jgi:hypothetical protein